MAERPKEEVNEVQVRCFKIALPNGRNYSLDPLSDVVERQGSTLLNSMKEGGGSVQIRTTGAVTETLFILGGRRSITQWLRQHGNTPGIGNSHGTIYATIMRKKRVFGKDLTMVALSATENYWNRGDWMVSNSIDLQYAPVLTTLERKSKLYTPNQLADLFEQIFAHGGD